jgi:hypothetical protein
LRAVTKFPAWSPAWSRYPRAGRGSGVVTATPGSAAEIASLALVKEFNDFRTGWLQSPLGLLIAEMRQTGDYGRIEKSEAKRHHFVPQLLLREFSADPDRRALFQLDVSTGQPRKTSVRDAAFKHRLYAMVDEDGVASNVMEGYLALVESHAAPALERLRADPMGLTLADRATISFFLAIQTQRTPGSAARLGRIANGAFRDLAEEFLSGPGAIAERHRAIPNGPEGESDEQIETLRKETLAAVRSGDVILKDPGGAAFGIGFELAAELAPSIFEFKWTILRSGGGFVTSDRGFSIFDPSPRHPWSAEGVLSSPDSQTTVPLSQRSSLVLSPTGMATEVAEVGDREVQLVNLRTYGWADRFVYGSSQDTLQGVRRSAKRRPADVLRPRSPCTVTLLDFDPDDDLFRAVNRRKGWPETLLHDGVTHDYVVFDVDRPDPYMKTRVAESVERRERQRQGLKAGEPLVGQLRVNPLRSPEVG